MAHNAPYKGYRLHFAVPDSAVKSFRLLHAGLDRTTYRTDKDLMYVLDEWAHDSWLSGKYETILDEGRPSILIDMRGRGPDLWCLVRDNMVKGMRGQDKAILLVLNTAMVNESKANGRWTDHKMSPGKPMQTIREALRGKSLELVAEIAKVPVKSPAHVPAQAPDLHRVVWLEGDEGVDEKKHEQDFVSKEAALAFIDELVNVQEVHPGDITIFKQILVPTWVEVKRKTKIVLE